MGPQQYGLHPPTVERIAGEVEARCTGSASRSPW